MSHQIDLNKFSGGALAERFNIEMRKLLENIKDPNTDHKAKRKLNITLTLSTNEERELIDTDISVKSSPAPRKSFSTMIIIDNDEHGQIVGAELKSGVKGQTYFDDQDEQIKEDTGNVIDYRKTKEGGNK